MSIAPQLSGLSPKVTLICAGYPDPPAPPTLVIGTRDIISVRWQLPTFNGGSPVLGFFVHMKANDDTEYTLVQDGGEDPTLLTFTTEVDHKGDPIVPRSYLFVVSARNWVGTGA